MRHIDKLSLRRAIAPVDDSRMRLRESLSDTFAKGRYQIAVGIAVAILLPMLVRTLATGLQVSSPYQVNTAIGSIAALICGYASFRRIHVLPGITSGGYIATSFTIWFGVLATALFLMRLPYTTVHFTINYLITMAFFIFIHLFFVNRRKIAMGVVPGPATESLPILSRVEWHYIKAPDAQIPRLNGVVVDLQAGHSDEWSARIASFALEGIPVYHVKDMIENLTGVVAIGQLSENTLGSLNPNDLYFALKACFDVIVAAVSLIMLIPLFLVIMVIIRLETPGPALFRQERTGFRKRPFMVYKFRTMISNGPERSTDRISAITQHRDPRITRFGAFLRRSRIDELPQLFNVLRGQMSLIGPRPEVVALTQWYEGEIPFYHYRHIIKPGITGWAQVNQGHVSDVTDVIHKLHLDFYYIKHFSFWLDVLIFLKTIRTILVGHGAK